ncbi:putative bifunctional diguanylate cyclase/phosphodiesterase [Paenibacillus daejeonensis]|uniref:putative bifunctional diguanylate cyclase/phosphodiesterase n=1 Tax=Paenibacillus daejeonensis TaxID=135193 RepID=UPI00039B2AFA|nr:EAL domain-containing protein [Paenibacillus daejeonensis]
MNELWEPLHMNWLWLVTALAAGIAGAVFITYLSPPAPVPGSRLPRKTKLWAMVGGTVAFTLSHLLVPLSFNIPVDNTYYLFHVLFTLLGCYAATWFSQWYIALPWGGKPQYIRTGVIASSIILIFDYTNLLLLFRGQLRWQPELVGMTVVLVFGLIFAVLRMLAFSSRHRQERRRSSATLPGVLLSGLALFAIPLLCAFSILPTERLGDSALAYLLPYTLLMLTGGLLYSLPDLAISRARQDGVTIWNLAYRDELTGLPNRRAFNDALDTYMSTETGPPTALTLFFIDLDKFKRINDLFGHAAGDLVLQVSADKLKACLPPECMLARMGGDEFTVLLPGEHGVPELKQLASRIVKAFEAPFQAGLHTVKLSASVGIARCPEEGIDASTLLGAADTAMYAAKENGSSQYQFYDPLRDQNGHRQLMLEQDLESAICTGQLRLMYQPKIDIRDGRTIGLEALVRWQHPTLGLVPPMQFIPLAEKTGLIVPLEQWVIREVCRQMKLWQETAALYMPIAVNISQVHLMRPDMDQFIIQSLEDAGIAREWLEIEITESVMMHNEEHVIDVLNRLKEAGISVSMDDFGTGYSSLSYLSTLPISCLKIDRSFVRKLASDRDSRAIAELIIGLARQLGLKIVAEGVETSEQVHLLKELQCYNAQGFYYSKPMPPEQALICMMGTNGDSEERLAADVPAG